ncbi:phosphatidylinositol alpha-1,6-mannosyltransferase [Pedobacter sp. UYP30]|uniref:glycosyltransferase family 4 protein n=1 Tax=Pedobacter sp. UYP30 TaxID=1756400 RepID=UPI003394E568
MLLLTLKTFSLTGGIEKVSKILTKVLNDNNLGDKVESNRSFKMLSLCDKTSDLDLRYCAAENFLGFESNKLRFTIMAFREALTCETIILSHINLLIIAVLIKQFSPKKRIILIAHGIEVWRDLSKWKTNFLRKQVEIWAVSNFTAKALIENHHIDKKSIVVLNNCLDPFFKLPTTFEKPTYLLKRHLLEKQQPVLLTVSRLSSDELYKGYDLIIESLKNILPTFPDLKYVLAGKCDVKEKKRILTLIKKNELQEQVLLLDFISDDELADYFLLADLFIMPSKKEGFGIVFIEAAACGCTVMAGNQDGSTDALLNGDLGILINPADLSEMEASILKFLKNKKKEANAKMIQDKCIDHFSYTIYKNNVLELLSKKHASLHL